MALTVSDARSYSLNITINAIAIDLLTSPSDSYNIEMAIFLDSHRHMDYIVSAILLCIAQPAAHGISMSLN
jgi:hypothetical protein